MRDDTVQFQTRPLQSALCILALLGAAIYISGCESKEERAIRRSCRWNHDIALNGCDRWNYARCIENCEYCVGTLGSPFQGTSDECNQLKCGAYCANQDSDPKCLSTYRVLCGQGKEAYAKHHQGQACDVDCNAASRAQPQMAAVVSVMFFASARLPTRALILIGGLAFAFLIQGCEDQENTQKYDRGQSSQGSSLSSSSGMGPTCIPNKPLLPDWTPDVARMDVKAGCKEEWNWWSGNPCASEVPVLFAKKGVYADIDTKRILEGVENEYYNCTKKIDGYCAEWTNFEKKCNEEDFGVCTCSMASDNKQYCHSWRCVTKEAEQNICWRACCGKNCHPCKKCGPHGSAPFEMNRNVFDTLMAQDGFPVGGDNWTNWDLMLATMRQRHWSHSYYQGTCISSRDVTNTDTFICDEWREIETEIQDCYCLRADATESFCMEWKCEEKDVGQFSILFTVKQSYEELIVGQEIEKYTCTNQESTMSGTSKCTGWRGEIESLEEVEVVQCRGCADLSTPHCQSWVCDEYEIPRILHEHTTWPYRVGMACCNMIWIVIVASMCAVCMPGVHATESLPVVCAASCCMTTCFGLSVYVIAFLRWNSDLMYWWTPTPPVWGILLSLVVAWPVYTCCYIVGSGNDEDGTSLPLCWLFGILSLGMTWVGGVSILAPFLGVCLCCSLVVLCGHSKSNKTEDSRTLVNEDFY